MDGQYFEVTALRPDTFIACAMKNIFIISKIKMLTKHWPMIQPIGSESLE
jgi:hypothetical protein